MEHLRNDALQTRDPPRLGLGPPLLSLDFLDEGAFGATNKIHAFQFQSGMPMASQIRLFHFKWNLLSLAFRASRVPA